MNKKVKIYPNSANLIYKIFKKLEIRCIYDNNKTDFFVVGANHQDNTVFLETLMIPKGSLFYKAIWVSFEEVDIKNFYFKRLYN